MQLCLAHEVYMSTSDTKKLSKMLPVQRLYIETKIQLL